RQNENPAQPRPPGPPGVTPVPPLLIHGRAETNQVPIRIGVRALAELAGCRAGRPGVAANARPAPLLVKGIGVAHVQVRRSMVRTIMVGVLGSVTGRNVGARR